MDELTKQEKTWIRRLSRAFRNNVMRFFKKFGRWKSANKTPRITGWYECMAVDDRWGGKIRYRAWGAGIWWTPIQDGWITSGAGIYRWRGPVAEVNGPAPDGTNPGCE